ncbi:methyltransferase domain-containing protein [Microlunatus parietis]|uniref:SAM-dependent methyltransferase n=1 Tax=Microlunatus parietis TaxID=682979 RepID=A0A7Y9ICX3_9ACTN|nr:class I SAM-dependent methyltransferase [Microlunatus parietis]NYE73984.1 SAM-dependent methyltransferase [Microlunatus parietis]
MITSPVRAERRLSPLRLYAAALDGRPTTMITEAGEERGLPVDIWAGAAGDADRMLLTRCAGPTLDLGCGPGRLAQALQGTGAPVLGVDLSPSAVRAAVGRGVVALCRDLFAPLPAEGRWQTILLADGNIGIGGDAVRLLARCRALLAPGGRILLDLAEPGTGYVRRRVRLAAVGRFSGWFPWCWVDHRALAALADWCGLRLVDHWTASDRRQAELIAVRP